MPDKHRVRLGSGPHPERWVLVGGEHERVGGDSVVPPEEADEEVEQDAGVAAGDQDCKPGDHDRDKGYEAKEEQNQVVRNRQQPLDQGQPAVELGTRVGYRMFRWTACSSSVDGYSSRKKSR